MSLTYEEASKGLSQKIAAYAAARDKAANDGGYLQQAQDGLQNFAQSDYAAPVAGAALGAGIGAAGSAMSGKKDKNYMRNMILGAGLGGGLGLGYNAYQGAQTPGDMGQAVDSPIQPGLPTNSGEVIA